MYQMNCECEQGFHSAALERAEIGEGMLEKIPEMLGEYKRIYLVADENTYRVAGARVEKLLEEAGNLSHSYVIASPALPDDKTVGCVCIEACRIKSGQDIGRLEPKPDYLLAVGSGTVNDICRIVAHRMGIPYGIAGTAPSMDGYASAGSPTLHRGTKMTVQCVTPRHIFADLAVMAEAPYPMLLAGIGDMAGKYIAILDWELAHRDTGEYYCPKIASQVLSATDACMENAGELKSRGYKTIKNIMEGLVVSGLGMAYTGVSRPAAGGEHMIAHVWEVMDIEEGNEPKLHGLEVGEGTLAAIFMYRKLYRETDDAGLKTLIEKYLPSFDRVETVCKNEKLPFTVTDRQRFLDGILRARTFRKRYTFLEYLGQRGLLERYARECADCLIPKQA